MKQRKLVIDKQRGNQWVFTVLDQYTLHLKETITIRGKEFFPDLSNELWVFALLEVGSQKVYFKFENEVNQIPPGVYGFLKPPFGLTEIGSENTKLTLNAILSRHPFPEGCPTEPSLFKLQRNELPGCYEEIHQIIRTLPVQYIISRYHSKGVSGIAGKIKRLIERHYYHPMNLNEIARKTGISQNLMSMYFKKSFYITPSEYRKQLRVKSSVFQLLESASTKKNIADIAFNCGYHDLSRYNKQFKSFTGVTPRQVKT